MARTSAALLLYRLSAAATLEVLLVHPGGPFWRHKDEGAWSIPKGEHGPDEDPHEVAVREFTEELGSPPPDAADPDVDLGAITQAAGKVVRCWARPGSLDVTTIASNLFEVEWPPRSGQRQLFPEVDRAEWFPLDEARTKLNPAQVELLDRLEAQRERR